MMKKSIIALFLAFTLLFGFAACRKVEKGDTKEQTEIQSNVFSVDSDGVTHNIQASVDEEGKTQYFYIDSNGQEVTVAPDKVVVETSAVKAIAATKKDGSLTPEAKSIYDIFNDPSSFNKMIDNTLPSQTLEFGDKTIANDKIKKVKASLSTKGQPLHPIIDEGAGTQVDYKEVLKGNKYTVSLTISANVEGQEMTIPVIFMKNGDMLYMNSYMPINNEGSTETDFIIRDGKCYMVIPSMRCYMATPIDTAEDIFSPEMLDLDNIDGDYVSSGQVTIGNKVYDCDTYNIDGGMVRYFYLNGNIKRIETVMGDETSIVEIRYISKNVDNNKFNVPSGYFDMMALMGESTTAK